MNDPQTLQLIGTFGTLASVLTVGWKLVRSINRIEFRVGLMWAKFKEEHGINDNGAD